MALDGLRQEFPEVPALARRVPSPRVARTTVVWAVLAAFGAALFVSAALTTPLGLFRLAAAEIGPIQVSQLVGALAIGVAFAVAWIAGGRQAAIAYGAILLLERILAALALIGICDRMGGLTDFCSMPLYVLSLWPTVLGIGIAYVLAGWIRRADGDRNALLESAGALALVQQLLSRLYSALFSSASGLESGLAFAAVAVIAGVACGLVLLQRVAPARRWPVLGLIALAIVGPWLLLSVPQFMEQVGIGGGLAISGFGLIGFAAPLLQVFAAAMVLYIAAARQVAAET
jgi:hypothetical protein